MDLIHTLILSLVEGVTEFLPISSTGHLILASHALGIHETNFVKSFEIIIQLGAILAVVVLYWRTLLFKRAYWPKIILAFLPTAVVGFTLYPLIKGVLLSSPDVTLTSLFVGGVILIAIEKFHIEKDSHAASIDSISNKQAFFIGCFQSLSVIPGVSRAAATIVGGMLTGAKRTAAVEFSFLLAVPTMVAASGLDLIKSHSHFTSSEVTTLLIGFVASFIVALIVIRYFLQFIKHHSFVPFGIYRILLALVYWLVLIR
ncbi:MAG TPA: undecaprenyl-diphosphate phosphatase [Patescibacteria group bacterium]|nr:undecaprenyl-diphosphate phosphatase [Patescibacteria group bacterium]